MYYNVTVMFTGSYEFDIEAPTAYEAELYGLKMAEGYQGQGADFVRVDAAYATEKGDVDDTSD